MKSINQVENCPVDTQIYLKHQKDGKGGGQTLSWRASEGAKHTGGCLLLSSHLEMHTEPGLVADGPCMARRGHVPGDPPRHTILLLNTPGFLL